MKWVDLAALSLKVPRQERGDCFCAMQLHSVPGINRLAQLNAGCNPLAATYLARVTGVVSGGGRDVSSPAVRILGGNAPPPPRAFAVKHVLGTYRNSWIFQHFRN